MKQSPRLVQFAASLFVILCFAPPGRLKAAEDYQGAKAVLQKLNGNKDQSTAHGPGEVQKLRKDIADFQKNAASLPPSDAATGWLALVDRSLQLKAHPVANEDGILEIPVMKDVFSALPPPSDWDAIAKAVDARPVAKGRHAFYDAGLRLIAHTLVSDREAQEKDAETLNSLFAKGSSKMMGYYYFQLTQQLSRALIAGTDNPDAIQKALEQELDAFKAVTDPNRLSYSAFELPDLVTLLGKEKASEFLRRVLRESPVTLDIRIGAETRDLARDLALEMVADLKAPQWKLACSLEGGPLYEALSKRFPIPAQNIVAGVISSLSGRRTQQTYDNSGRNEAQSYYLLGLIAHQQTQQAVDLAKQLGATANPIPYGAMDQLERAGYIIPVNDFFFQLLTDNPGLPFWDELITVSAKAGTTDKLLDLARKSLARTDLTESQRSVVAGQLYKVLLAAGQTDEGVKELRQVIASGPSAASSSDNNNYPGLKLARIGMLLEHQDWIDEGLTAARKQLETGDTDDNQQTATVGLAELLEELNRGPEAESVLADALAKANSDARNQQYYGGSMVYSTNGKLMLALLRLYHDAGRSADVLALLDQAPNWGTPDLATFYADEIEPGVVTEFYTHAAKDDTNAGYIAASALAAMGRKDEAKKIVNAVLDRKGEFDPAYELLLQLEGQKAIPRLDELFSRDQFQGRPLIWKAQLLKQAGKLEEAEKCVRQAITIDPSDGEQGPGRRMRAYAVLADIREARGDAKEAQFFREVVNAIQLSEKADRFYEAGMLSRAVSMYQDSLTHFSDAYCIQSRLALRLSELGQNDAAEEHYRKAYELMPGSFGRVESHCFGCERAFAGKRAQSIAEKVFTGLAEKTPDKPQVHYLLGYLRYEEDRFKEALPEFQTAVKLDPEYLNAWKKIQETGRELRLPVADRDAVTFNILRLDPLGRHSYNEFTDVGDLRTLWKTVAASTDKQPAKPTGLYPLVASKAELDKTGKTRELIIQRAYSSGMEDDSRSPADAIARNVFIQTAGTLMEQAGQIQDGGE